MNDTFECSCVINDAFCGLSNQWHLVCMHILETILVVIACCIVSYAATINLAGLACAWK